MKILIIHQNFPAQYRRLVPALLAKGHTLRALSQRKEKTLLGVRNYYYPIHQNALSNQHDWLRSSESALLRAQAIATVCEYWKKTGYSPDVILVHTGWGESLFLKDVWSNARVIGYFEYFYHTQGAEVNFDPEFPAKPDIAYRLRMRNQHLLSSLQSCDMGVTPTQWQYSRFPTEWQKKLQVIHEGIDTNNARPLSTAWIKLSNNRVLSTGDEVITFVNRNLEPLRGYHRFMRALPAILKARPLAQVIIIGGDRHSYGRKPTAYQSYKQQFLQEVKGQLDMQRVHFVGHVDYTTFLKILQISSVHVYLTYPFILSWSLLEAMSAQCAIVASRTAPVQEVIKHTQTGLLVDFFDQDSLIEQISQLLAQRSQQHYCTIRENARQFVKQFYDFQTVCLPKQLAIIGSH
ncbi:MAG TPA: glycosyltransferase [Thiothrix sp.]|nr:glycosyltransferase [Thiothrix sp.]